MITNSSRNSPPASSPIPAEAGTLPYLGRILESVFDSSPLLVAILSVEDRRFLAVNNAFLRTFGSDPGAMVGKTCGEAGLSLTPTEGGADTLDDLVRAAMGDGNRHGTDLRVVSAAGSCMFARVTVETVMVEDRRFLIVTILDLSVQKKAEKELERRIQFDDLLMRSASALVGAHYDLVDPVLDGILKEIGEFGGASRAYVMQFDLVRRRKRMANEWCAPGVESLKDSLQNLELESFPKFMAEILAGREVHTEDIESLPPDWAEEKDGFRAEGVGKLIAIPLQSGLRTLGFLGFNSADSSRVWPAGYRRLLGILAGNIADTWTRRAQDERLQASAVTSQEAASRSERDVGKRLTRLEVFNNNARKSLDAFAAAVSALAATSLDPAQRELMFRIESGMRDLAGISEEGRKFIEEVSHRHTANPYGAAPADMDRAELLADLHRHLAGQEPSGCAANIAQLACLNWPGEERATFEKVALAVEQFRFRDAISALESLSASR